MINFYAIFRPTNHKRGPREKWRWKQPETFWSKLSVSLLGQILHWQSLYSQNHLCICRQCVSNGEIWMEFSVLNHQQMYTYIDLLSAWSEKDWKRLWSDFVFQDLEEGLLLSLHVAGRGYLFKRHKSLIFKLKKHCKYCKSCFTQVTWMSVSSIPVSPVCPLGSQDPEILASYNPIKEEDP